MLRVNSKGRRIAVVLAAVAIVLIVYPGRKLYRVYSRGEACSSCHEIAQPYNDWHTSAHRNVPCADCHGGVFTFEAGFHLNNIRRMFVHARGKAPEKPHMRTADVIKIADRCRQCHQAEFASWRSGAHSATYKDIFLSTKQNQHNLLMDDCLRCHGMHFQGPVRDLVGPINRTGPWKMLQSAMADQPVLPCLSCHRIHRVGAPLSQAKHGEPIPPPLQEINRPSVALFDRREMDHVAVGELSLPVMLEGTRVVKMAPDQRQALCYQCHAPRAERQVKSGDDRTPIGVHEGLSCFDCHLFHGEQTRASCATCHPMFSDCKIAVEKMDTTFKDKNSRHNIHTTKCTDCHTKGIPKPKVPGEGHPNRS